MITKIYPLQNNDSNLAAFWPGRSIDQQVRTVNLTYLSLIQTIDELQLPITIAKTEISHSEEGLIIQIIPPENSETLQPGDIHIIEQFKNNPNLILSLKTHLTENARDQGLTEEQVNSIANKVEEQLAHTKPTDYLKAPNGSLTLINW